MTLQQGLSWSKTYDGGAGKDTIFTRESYGRYTGWFTLTANAQGVVTATSATGGGYQLKFKNFEKITLGALTIKLGTSANDTIKGGISSDKFLYGLGGNDTIDGGAGADIMMGGFGNDTYIVDNSADKVLESVSQGMDTVKSSVSLKLATNVENLMLTGTKAINATGNGNGNVLTGNANANVMTGGAGKDIMTGGLGVDLFDFNAVSETTKLDTTRDIIKDFVHLSDWIDLSTIDASVMDSGNNVFVFIGELAFSNAAGELRFVVEDLDATASDKTIIEGDVDGDGAADFQIQLTGVVVLTAEDFIL